MTRTGCEVGFGLRRSVMQVFSVQLSGITDHFRDKDVVGQDAFTRIYSVQGSGAEAKLTGIARGPGREREYVAVAAPG